jgi:lipoprotein NlpD
MFKKSLLLAFLALGFFSCARAPRPITKTAPVYQITPPKTLSKTEAKTSSRTYTIKKGDSLWQIARQYRTTIPAITSVNRGINPNNLIIGQKINIPKTSTSRSSSFLLPVKGEIINFFGEKVDGLLNHGIDFMTQNNSREVSASASGKIIFADDLKGWGKAIVIAHNQEIYTIYANLGEILVKEGRWAKKGDIIANVAQGKNKNHILHFEVRKRSVPQDPLIYLN